MELTKTTTISLFGNQLHCTVEELTHSASAMFFPLQKVSTKIEDYFRRPLLILNLYVVVVVVDISKLDLKSLTIVQKNIGSVRTLKNVILHSWHAAKTQSSFDKISHLLGKSLH